jgi:pyruvate dehydrogenase E1 component alpha subunit
VEPILKGEARCPVHLYSGEEAIAAGVCAVLTKKDYVFSTHRSHGHYLAKGGDMVALMAEIYGKETGCSRGRGGSMHLIAPDKGLMGSAPIVAGTISLAVGAALASSIRKEKRVTVSFFGDGAAGEGVLYESLNFAALRKLPIIFVCENNLYSTHLHISECRAGNTIYETGKLFRIKSYRSDGNDVLQVYKIAKKAAELCRKGQGPVFLEFMTYRMRGHVGPDDNIQGAHTDIRPEKEVSKWREKDPINKYERFLIKNKIMNKEDMGKIWKQAEKEAHKAHVFALNSPYPKKGELTKHVFKE